MDNDENAEQIIALSALEDQTFEDCTEIIITEDTSDNEAPAEETQTENLVLDISDNVTADLYPDETELQQISIKTSEDGERKKAGGQHFMLSSVEALKELLEEYYERTSTRFVGWRKTKNFGLPSNECSLSGHQVQWCDTVRNTNNGLDNLVPFDGIPYMIVGHYDMDCQFGNDRNASGKAKRQQKKAAGLINTRTHYFTQPTKRCGCPAKISVKQIIRFPEFKIDSDSKWKKNDRSMKLKAKLKECRENVQMEVFFVGRLPEIFEHKHHDSCKATEAVLQELIVLAQEFYLEEKTYSQIQQLLNQHVIDHLFWNKPPPHRSRRKFYPTLRDIRYFCTRALHLLRFSDEEQEYMRKVISDIESQGNANVSFILSEGKMIKNDDALIDDADNTDNAKKLPKKPDERKIQSFLFCTQTDSQRRLLKRYNNVAYLIEVVDKLPVKYAYAYQMYTIIVQTNVDYQVAACIAVSKQKKEGLCDALKLLREWNPTWNPKYFMVDCSAVIYEAISSIFPECQYFLNPQSCEEKWSEFFNKPSNNLQEHSEEIMNYLKTMQYSLTEDSLSVAAALLEGSDIWQDRDNLREWFQNSWLPLAKQWVFGYRPEDLMILQHLKASIDDCLFVYREVLRKASKFKGFMEMVEQVSVSIPSVEYDKYVERNKRAYLFYTHYSKTTPIPPYVKNVPISLLPYIEGVCRLAESTNFVISRDNYDAFTVQFSPIDVIMNSDPQIEGNLSEWRPREGDVEPVALSVLKQVRLEETKEMEMVETEFGWIEYSNKVLPGENTISFGDSYSHPFCTCSHWLLYRLPCVHILAVFSKTNGWKYDMISPLYRASPLLEIDCSVLNFPLHEPELSYICDKQCQTDFQPITAATQTCKLKTNLEDSVLEVPSKIWDYFIVLTQTRDFLKHLDKMAFLFKDKNLHLQFRHQVMEVISKLEDDALKKRGQKIEFTTRNVTTPKKAVDSSNNALKISSLNLETIHQNSGEPKKIIIQNGAQLGAETVTGIYRVNNNCVSGTTSKSAKATPLKKSSTNTSVNNSLATCTSVDTPATSLVTVCRTPACSEKQTIVSSGEALVEPHTVVTPMQTSLTTTVGSDPNLVVMNNLPLLKDIRDKSDQLLKDVQNKNESNSRKRKLDSCSKTPEPNLSENDSPVSDSQSGEKNDYLSVLKYLPLLNKTPKQGSSISTPKISSNINLLKCLPPNVGLTRPSSFTESTSIDADDDFSPESSPSLVEVLASSPQSSEEITLDIISDDCADTSQSSDESKPS